MDHPKISVIVPVYKVEPYLRRCVDSIINQTYKNLEIILVDDGSPDNCGTICDEYAAIDNRIIVMHTENGGAYAARNRALDTASGEYISFVDADDWISQEMYETLLFLLTEYNADISQCEMKNEGTYSQIRSFKFGVPVTYERGQLKTAFFNEYITHGLLGKLYTASIWRCMRFDDGYYHVDAVTMSKVSEFCNRYVRTDSALYHYNTTNESITRGPRKPLHITSAENLFEAYSAAASNSSEGSFFICREIPSSGWLICPGRNITLRESVRHIHVMHKIFIRHWVRAKAADQYRIAPRAKRALWSIYRICPVAASIMLYGYDHLRKRKRAV